MRCEYIADRAPRQYDVCDDDGSGEDWCWFKRWGDLGEVERPRL